MGFPRGDAPGAVEVCCMDELPAADVDADVSEPVEEDEIAGLELGGRDRSGRVPLGHGVVRERHAELRVTDR
jgi:hypothetical protein